VRHRVAGTLAKGMLSGAWPPAQGARSRWARDATLREGSLESGWAGLQAFSTCKPHSHLLWNPYKESPDRQRALFELQAGESRLYLNQYIFTICALVSKCRYPLERPSTDKPRRFVARWQPAVFAGHRSQASPRLLPAGNQQSLRATTIKQTS
jgi:hypothetical protein